jgi:hypothetical protein
MHLAYVVITVLAAVVRAQWVRDNMKSYGIPEWTLYPLAATKAIGALGLLVGLAIPPLGLAAAACLVLYFIGAVLTIVRAHGYADLKYPLPFLALAAGSLILFAAA